MKKSKIRTWSPADPTNPVFESSKQRSPHGLEPICIVITGASSGLGAGLARAYAAPGRVLGLIGRNASRLAEVADDCRRGGAVAQTAALDVADPAAISD